MREDVWSRKPEPVIPTYHGKILRDECGNEVHKLWYMHAEIEIWLRELKREWDKLVQSSIKVIE